MQLLFALSCICLHLPSVLIRYYPFRGITTPKRRRFLFFVYIAVFLFMGVVYYVFGTKYTFLVHKILILFTAIVFAVINIVAIPGHWREHLFSSSLASLHVSATFYTCLFFIRRAGYTGDTMQIATISAFLTFGVFALLIKVYLNSASRVVTPFLGYDSVHYWKRVWYLPVPLFLASFWASPIDSYNNDWYSLVNRVFILGAAILICNAITEDHKYMLYRLRVTEQLTTQRDYIDHLSEHVKEARKSRHDFKHHLAAIRRYIDTDDKDGIEDYWEELNIRVNTATEVPCTGNTAFDGILYHYSLLAKEQNIDFEITGFLDKLVMSDTDFAVLMGNALDNAYKGCMTVEENRKIIVNMKVGRSEQMILISNTYDGVIDKNEEMLFSRRRTASAGIGLESMRSICEKYDSAIDVKYSNNMFAVLLILKIERE